MTMLFYKVIDQNLKTVKEFLRKREAENYANMLFVQDRKNYYVVEDYK